MLSKLIGNDTAAAELKRGLSTSSRNVRAIAHRVANASNPDFVAVLDSFGNPGSGEVRIEEEMVALADEQLRFETAARLLQKVYQQIRSSIRER